VGQDDVTGLAAALTSEGTILGTPQYMAPEQYEGKEADERSDIFAFGCVVYEMVTGKRCFDGKTKASLIASVLGGEPAPMSTLVPVTPPALERLVKRCIEKDPEDRYQSMRDVVLDLRSIGAGGTEVKAQAKGLLHTQVWIVAGVVVAVVAALGAWMLKPAPARPVTRLVIALGPDEHLANLNTPAVAISPDGANIVYVASRGNGPAQLFLRALDALKAQPITGTEGALSPFFSPDG
jgi:hypothetical protein